MQILIAFVQGVDSLLKGATMQPCPSVDNYFSKDVRRKKYIVYRIFMLYLKKKSRAATICQQT